ncbi:MAG TPA: EamA family transporter [Thermoanaerobaculia bacterium]|nr:EamA family transporter [Thermoanaerobaculia bacterium]
MKRGVVPALLVIYVVWGSTYLAIRWGLETIPPFAMAGARYLVAGGVLLAWVKLRGAPRVTFRELGPAFLTGGLMLLCGNGGVVWAEQRIASGLAALLIAVEPLFIVLLQATLPQERRRPSARALVGVAFGVAGVILLVGPVRLGGERVDLAGAGAVLFAAFAWALGSLLSRHLAPPASPLQATALQMLAGGALLGCASGAAGEWARFSPALVSGRSLAAVAYLVVFGSLLAFTAYIWLLRVASPALVSTYAFVNPIVAVFLGWLLASEEVGMRTLAAAAVIVAAVVLITLGETRRRPT